MKPVLFAMLLTLAAASAADTPLIQPAELASMISSHSSQAAIIHVGPGFLYRGKHIPGSIYAGQASKPEGLDALKQAVAKLPHDRQIYLYCGCCPWDHCPNIKPAAELLRTMGFTHVKAVHIATNFKTDWTDQGYPVEAGSDKQ